LAKRLESKPGALARSAEIAVVGMTPGVSGGGVVSRSRGDGDSRHSSHYAWQPRFLRGCSTSAAYR